MSDQEQGGSSPDLADALLGDHEAGQGAAEDASLPPITPSNESDVSAAEMLRLDRQARELKHDREQKAIEHDFAVARERLRNQTKMTDLREKFANRMFYLLVGETVAIFFLVAVAGKKWLDLSDVVLGSIANATIVQVAVLVAIILRNLFPSGESGDGLTPLAPAEKPAEAKEK